MLKKTLTMLIAFVMVFSCATVAFATDDETEILLANGYMQGDVNMDGSIGVTDVILVLRHIIGKTTFNEKECSLADMNSDDEISVVDAIYIQKIIVNIQEPSTENPTVSDEYDKPIELPFVPAV